MPDWMSYKLQSRLLGETSTTSYADYIILKAGSEEILRNLLMRKESGKSWLKTKY